jgi:uncharacterized membrane protein
MSEIFQDEHVTATLADGLLHLAWARDVSDDAKGIALAQQLTAALGRAVHGQKPSSIAMLVDLMAIRKAAPKANAVFLEWLRRDWRVFRVTAFASSNILLRSSLKVASLIPGINVNGFATVEEARAFLARS